MDVECQQIMVMYGQLIMVMYTGGKLPEFPGHETGFSSGNKTSPESSQDPDQISKLNYLIDDQQQVTTGSFTFFVSITLGTLPSQG